MVDVITRNAGPITPLRSAPRPPGESGESGEGPGLAVWRLAARLASAATNVPWPGDGKLSRAFTARRGLVERLRRWGAEGRHPSRPLLWLHAPSVGEGLQVVPVLGLIRQRRPDVQVVYTWFSPSAQRFAQRVGADWAGPLPFDAPRDVDAALSALRPSALVCAKLDVWPVLTATAARRGVRLGLISATVSPDSGRLRPLPRALLSGAYAALDAVGAISDEDAARLVMLGVRPDRIETTGDTRYDQVFARADDARAHHPAAAALVSPRPTLVAGSTWPSDEAVLFDAWASVRREVPGARLVIAPHEPTVRHLAPIERRGRDAGLIVARLGEPSAPSADVVLVDRVGVLGELYVLADVAWVGGGFHGAGLHSVLEPAAFGAPVVAGPRDPHQRDAARLEAAGGLRRVSDRRAAADVLCRWLLDHDARAAAGEAARRSVEHALGASERSFRLIERLLPPIR